MRIPASQATLRRHLGGRFVPGRGRGPGVEMGWANACRPNLRTAGLGPDGVRKDLFEPDFFPDHGGGVGETLYWATTTLFQRIGAHIIAVLLVVSGLLLISGRSVSDMVRGARRGAQRARQGTVDFATAVKESRVRTDPDLIDTSPGDTDPIFGPPEPVEGGGQDYQVLVGGDEERETEKVANFDEAVRVADDEPDT